MSIYSQRHTDITVSQYFLDHLNIHSQSQQNSCCTVSQVMDVHWGQASLTQNSVEAGIQSRLAKVVPCSTRKHKIEIFPVRACLASLLQLSNSMVFQCSNDKGYSSYAPTQFCSEGGLLQGSGAIAPISQNGRLQAVSLMYLAYTYSHCYYPRQPQKAIPLFHQALQNLGEDKTSLLYSDILMGLSEAYAQCKEEQKALHYSGLAQEHFPTYPENDPSFIYADCGLNTLYQWTGKMYLQLADHFPDTGYQQQAAGNLLQSIGSTSISDRSANETLIYRADSARLLRDLDIYVESLRQATRMALQIGSRRRYHDALLVYNRTPQAWRNEKPVKQLSKEFFKESLATIDQ